MFVVVALRATQCGAQAMSLVPGACATLNKMRFFVQNDQSYRTSAPCHRASRITGIKISFDFRGKPCSSGSGLAIWLASRARGL